MVVRKSELHAKQKKEDIIMINIKLLAVISDNARLEV